jgi:hypothetical protein
LFKQRQTNLLREFHRPLERTKGCCPHLTCGFFAGFR